MLQYDFVRNTEHEVAKLFGRSFAELLLEVQEGSWQGPIESGYGLHLVRIHDRIESRLPKIDEVLDRVKLDFLAERRRETNKKIYEQLKARYEIVVESPAATLEMAKQ